MDLYIIEHGALQDNGNLGWISLPPAAAACFKKLQDGFNLFCTSFSRQVSWGIVMRNREAGGGGGGETKKLCKMRGVVSYGRV